MRVRHNSCRLSPLHGPAHLPAVELRSSLEGRLGLELPATLVFDYPTISAIAGLLAGMLQASEAVLAGATDSGSAGAYYGFDLLSHLGGMAGPIPPAGSATAVAVGAVVTRQPAGVLAGGSLATRDATAIIGVDRWAVDSQASVVGGVPVRFASVMAGVDAFDAGAFSLSAAEAGLMDPQQRLLMECMAEGLMLTSGHMCQVNARGHPTCAFWSALCIQGAAAGTARGLPCIQEATWPPARSFGSSWSSWPSLLLHPILSFSAPPCFPSYDAGPRHKLLWRICGLLLGRLCQAGSGGPGRDCLHCHRRRS